MRASFLLFGCALGSLASPVAAADALKFGPPPSWVVPQAVPPPSDKGSDRPVAVLLHDQQVFFEGDKTSTYVETVVKIQKPEGLAVGNLSVAWNPALDTVTVNKLEIRRGDKVIDVLKSGQTFTTMRRESNLEMAMLDGVLTANIQPEGLQEGDVVVLAATTDHVDPALKGHVETRFAPWGAAQIALAHARLEWVPPIDLKIQKTGDLPLPQQAGRNGHKVYDLTMRDVQPLISPNSAPLRFSVGRMGEATDFRSWADAARIMIPLYREAAVVPATGPLREEVEKIRKASADPKIRTEQALALVQQRTRYVALLMGEGGYVPAPAAETWSRRFGDCKAKTALLLAILHELGIQAEPVTVNTAIGDAIADRLPQIGLFNHVLVRAHVAGKDYWLDGTRTGDTALERIRTPEFGWGLPIVEKAALVHIVPPPLAVADTERQIAIDASAGIYAPTKVVINELYRGDGALAFNRVYAQMSADQRAELLRQRAKRYFDAITVEPSTVQFDQATGELRISTKGTAKLDWEDGWFRVPNASIAYNPDFDRTAGPQHDAPFATNYPNFDTRKVTITLPKNYPGQDAKIPAAVHETLAGVEYVRTATISGNMLNVESSERTVAPEIPYKAALADAGRLKALDNDDVFLRIPARYKPSPEDLASLGGTTPVSASDYLNRGNTFLDGWKFDEAISDFTKTIELDPKNEWAFADRALGYIHKANLSAAEKDLAAAEALNPDNPVAARARGLIAEQKGDYKAANAAYTKSLIKDPNNSFALGHRAIVRNADNDEDGALADSSAALTKDPTFMDLRVMRANIAYRRGDRASVAKEAELTTQQNPDSSYAFVVAGKIYARLGDNAAAMKAFDRALAIKPEAFVYINRSQVRPLADKAARIADLDAALKLEPDNPDALVGKAQLLSRAGDYKQALELLDRVKPDPDDDYAQIQRAIVLSKAGRKTEAEKILGAERKSAKTASDFNSLCWNGAINEVDLEGALQDCRAALKQRPDAGAYLDSLGMVLLKLGKLDDALAAYNQAIAKKTGAASLMGRAFVYERLGKHAEATADAAAARRLAPEIDSTFADYGLKFDGGAAAQEATAH